mgnify:CR=1 FL=1
MLIWIAATEKQWIVSASHNTAVFCPVFVHRSFDATPL